MIKLFNIHGSLFRTVMGVQILSDLSPFSFSFNAFTSVYHHKVINKGVIKDVLFSD